MRVRVCACARACVCFVCCVSALFVCCPQMGEHTQVPVGAACGRGGAKALRPCDVCAPVLSGEGVKVTAWLGNAHKRLNISEGPGTCV